MELIGGDMMMSPQHHQILLGKQLLTQLLFGVLAVQRKSSQVSCCLEVESVILLPSAPLPSKSEGTGGQAVRSHPLLQPLIV